MKATKNAQPTANPNFAQKAPLKKPRAELTYTNAWAPFAFKVRSLKRDASLNATKNAQPTANPKFAQKAPLKKTKGGTYAHQQ